MIEMPLQDIYDGMLRLLWPLFRIAGLIALAPGLGDQPIPMRVKAGLALVCAVVLAPVLAPVPAVIPGSYASLKMAASEILIGMALGLCMRLVFMAFIMAGEFVGLQMGLAFASFFDPGSGANTAVTSRLINLVALLLFFTVNGHLVMLGSLLHSYSTLPLGHALDPNGWGELLDWSSQLWVSGMLLALPLIIVLLTINLSLGILNRTAQQLSVFAVGFPITLTTGITILAIVLPRSSGFMQNLFNQGYEAMARVLGRLAGL
ncbi:flagellar biosynthetic protein FliR [Castellaniella sp.]|uniref:flagellar biosynthetic protein FliR n=1 Tax=Castellaniella sp. TaxID=1955812 RepID=UPI00355EFB47